MSESSALQVENPRCIFHEGSSRVESGKHIIRVGATESPSPVPLTCICAIFDEFTSRVEKLGPAKSESLEFGSVVKRTVAFSDMKFPRPHGTRYGCLTVDGMGQNSAVVVKSMIRQNFLLVA